MNSFPKDFINALPDPVICHILSFLTTKEAASTSVLAKRWRYLLAFVPSLEFDDSVYLHPEERKEDSTSFEDFVTRILALQGNAPVDKFVLKIKESRDPVETNPWIHNVLARRVSELSLVMDFKYWKGSLTSRIFFSETLVKLRLYTKGIRIYVEDVHLPKLKTLCLEFVMFKEKAIGLSKLLSGCCVLEELVIYSIECCMWDSFSVSVSTLNRLTMNCTYCCHLHGDIAKFVSFDTPSLVYLEYSRRIANTYPKVNLHLLVEAKVDLYTDESDDESSDSELEDEIGQGNLVGNATDFMTGICNVRILSLSARTLHILMSYCKAIPIFSHLTHLTIESKPQVGWEPLPGLLNNCPILETLVFQGLLHKATDQCGEACLCKPREEEDIPSSLSSSLVKVLKIVMNDRRIEKQIEQVKYFLETMPNLEQLLLYYASAFDKNVKVSTQLQILTSVASPKCEVKLIPGKLSVSSTVPSAVSTKWVPLP